MIAKHDLQFSNWGIEKANQRIEKSWGNYLYECSVIPEMDKVTNVYWNGDHWLVETCWPMNEFEEDITFAKYCGRGYLEERLAYA